MGLSSPATLLFPLFLALCPPHQLSLSFSNILLCTLGLYHASDLASQKEESIAPALEDDTCSTSQSTAFNCSPIHRFPSLFVLYAGGIQVSAHL